MQEEQPVEDFWIALFNKIDYRIGLDYHSKFLIAILQEINNLLDEKQQFSIKILDSLNPIIYTTYNINPIIDSDDQAYYEFIWFNKCSISSRGIILGRIKFSLNLTFIFRNGLSLINSFSSK